MAVTYRQTDRHDESSSFHFFAICLRNPKKEDHYLQCKWSDGTSDFRLTRRDRYKKRVKIISVCAVVLNNRVLSQEQFKRHRQRNKRLLVNGGPSVIACASFVDNDIYSVFSFCLPILQGHVINSFLSTKSGILKIPNAESGRFFFWSCWKLYLLIVIL